MRCKNCGTKWSCEISEAPGGNNAPGVFLIAGSAFAVVAIALHHFHIWRIVQIIAAGGAVLSLGYLPLCIWECWKFRHCPKCSRAHVVWPWSF